MLVDARFELTEESAKTVGSIVRSLDGMPLAIEIAAAQLDVTTLPDLASGLQDRLITLASWDRRV